MVVNVTEKSQKLSLLFELGLKCVVGSPIIYCKNQVSLGQITRGV